MFRVPVLLVAIGFLAACGHEKGEILKRDRVGNVWVLQSVPTGGATVDFYLNLSVCKRDNGSCSRNMVLRGRRTAVPVTAGGGVYIDIHLSPSELEELEYFSSGFPGGLLRLRVQRDLTGS